MNLAIFDLDNTLLAVDSDYLWGQFLVEKGLVDGKLYEETNDRFYKDYREGKLDMDAFLAFALRPLATIEPNELYEWRKIFIAEKIKPALLPKAHELVDSHRTSGHELLVITATNQFVTEPIVNLYGISQILATVPEQQEGRFTGRFIGIPCFQDGKVKRLNQWLESNEIKYSETWFYSDSHNDLPLLNIVNHPFAVDPDASLKQTAIDRGWPIISLRD